MTSPPLFHPPSSSPPPSGWRPKRSIVFGSWGAGEFGFFGATEFVEEYLKSFENRAVAYLNVDIAVIQTYNLVVSATPLLHRVIREAAKRVRRMGVVALE